MEEPQPGRKAFSFDPNRCTGCQACELACSIENELDGFSWRQVETFNAQRHPGAPMIHLSMACNHCADAPCMEHCPALAYTQDEETGIVTLHADRCIGCRYCSWACPYDAPKFDEPQGVMTKCTFCSHRQAEGLDPACVVQCPTGALGFSELDGLEGAASMVGLPTTDPGPSIRFTPWRGQQPPDDSVDMNTQYMGSAAKITLRTEWPLWAFTLLAAGLVAAVAASALGALSLPFVLFLAVAGTSMALSSLHLGQKHRAWRAMLNIRHSWLSREILSYSGFVGLASLHLLLPDVKVLGLSAVLAGLAALISIDRVYDLVLRHERWRAHSADVLLTGPMLAALLVGSLPFALVLAAVKVGLYLSRKLRFAQHGWLVRQGWSSLRLAAGFIGPVIAGALDPTHWAVWALVGTVVGELIDRGEFYTELRVPTPAEHMTWNLERVAAAGQVSAS